MRQKSGEKNLAKRKGIGDADEKTPRGGETATKGNQLVTMISFVRGGKNALGGERGGGPTKTCVRATKLGQMSFGKWG